MSTPTPVIAAHLGDPDSAKWLDVAIKSSDVIVLVLYKHAFLVTNRYSSTK